MKRLMAVVAVMAAVCMVYGQGFYPPYDGGGTLGLPGYRVNVYAITTTVDTINGPATNQFGVSSAVATGIAQDVASGYMPLTGGTISVPTDPSAAYMQIFSAGIAMGSTNASDPSYSSFVRGSIYNIGPSYYAQILFPQFLGTDTLAVRGDIATAVAAAATAGSNYAWSAAAGAYTAAVNYVAGMGYLTSAPPQSVVSVNGQTGAVTITAAGIGADPAGSAGAVSTLVSNLNSTVGALGSTQATHTAQIAALATNTITPAQLNNEATAGSNAVNALTALLTITNAPGTIYTNVAVWAGPTTSRSSTNANTLYFQW